MTPKPDRTPITIQFSDGEERKALPILLRRFAGRLLPDKKYVISRDAVEWLRQAGIAFKTLSSADAEP